MQISLRRGEKIYLNGAVIQVGNKVSLRLLNDVAFLLESHVMQAENATTPLRQLYFVLQTMLMDPVAAQAIRQNYVEMRAALAASLKNKQILSGLDEVETLVAGDRLFDALKLLRSVFAIEDDLLAPVPAKSFFPKTNPEPEEPLWR